MVHDEDFNRGSIQLEGETELFSHTAEHGALFVYSSFFVKDGFSCVTVDNIAGEVESEVETSR
jgi:hypothetical protein